MAQRFFPAPLRLCGEHEARARKIGHPCRPSATKRSCSRSPTPPSRSLRVVLSICCVRSRRQNSSAVSTTIHPMKRCSRPGGRSPDSTRRCRGAENRVPDGDRDGCAKPSAKHDTCVAPDVSPGNRIEYRFESALADDTVVNSTAGKPYVT
jgi:hypothetical protein